MTGMFCNLLARKLNYLALIGNSQLTKRSENVAFSATFLPRGATFRFTISRCRSIFLPLPLSSPSFLALTYVHCHPLKSNYPQNGREFPCGRESDPGGGRYREQGLWNRPRSAAVDAPIGGMLWTQKNPA